MASSEERKRVLSSGRLLSVSDIHNTRHPPRHPMLSPREILFSFPEAQSASPTSFVVVHRLHLVSRFSLTLPPFNPTQLSALWKVSQRDRPFFRVLFVFPWAKPSPPSFFSRFSRITLSPLAYCREILLHGRRRRGRRLNCRQDLSIYVMVIARRETIVEISSNWDISRNGFASITSGHYFFRIANSVSAIRSLTGSFSLTVISFFLFFFCLCFISFFCVFHDERRLTKCE